MSFRPDGYLLLREAEFHLAGGYDNIPGAPMQEAAVELFGHHWFEERNRPSENFPGLSLILEQYGSTAYILNCVLSRWIFVSFLGGENLPTYFCSPTGQITRTFAFSACFEPYHRFESWEKFDPETASLERYIDAFMGIETETFSLLDESGLVKLPQSTLSSWRLTPKERAMSLQLQSPEFRPFVGWSVCVPDNETIRNCAKMLALCCPKRKPFPRNPTNTKGDFAQETEPQKPAGRPSLHPKILEDFRSRFKGGMENRSISEVSRILGYDRKTTRNALKAAGILPPS